MCSPDIYFNVLCDNLCSQQLLGKKDYDVDQLERFFDLIELKSAFLSAEQFNEGDLDSYVQHQNELLLNTTLEEAKKEVRRSSFLQFAC